MKRFIDRSVGTYFFGAPCTCICVRAGDSDPFTIITREAGAGRISMGIEGPSKAVIDFQDRRDGTSDVNYVVTEPGLIAALLLLSVLLLGYLRLLKRWQYATAHSTR